MELGLKILCKDEKSEISIREKYHFPIPHVPKLDLLYFVSQLLNNFFSKDVCRNTSMHLCIQLSFNSKNTKTALCFPGKETLFL